MYSTINDFTPGTSGDIQKRIDKHPVFVNVTPSNNRNGHIHNMRGAGMEMIRRPNYDHSYTIQKRFNVPGRYMENKGQTKFEYKHNPKRQNMNADIIRGSLRPSFKENPPVARFRNDNTKAVEMGITRGFLTDLTENLIQATTADPEDTEYIRIENEVRKANPNASEAEIRRLTRAKAGRAQRKDTRQMKLLTFLKSQSVSADEKLNQIVGLLQTGALNSEDKKKDALKILARYIVKQTNIKELVGNPNLLILTNFLVDYSDESDRIFYPFNNEGSMVPMMKFIKKYKDVQRGKNVDMLIPVYVDRDYNSGNTRFNDTYNIIDRDEWTTDAGAVRRDTNGLTLGALLNKSNIFLDWVDVVAIYGKEGSYEKGIRAYIESGYKPPDNNEWDDAFDNPGNEPMQTLLNIDPNQEQKDIKFIDDLVEAEEKKKISAPVLSNKDFAVKSGRVDKTFNYDWNNFVNTIVNANDGDKIKIADFETAVDELGVVIRQLDEHYSYNLSRINLNVDKINFTKEYSKFDVQRVREYYSRIAGILHMNRSKGKRRVFVTSWSPWNNSVRVLSILETTVKFLQNTKIGSGLHTGSGYMSHRKIKPNNAFTRMRIGY